ncbi:MAG TPA: HAD family phosphatase [Acidobacteriaceae bacterium]|jgi:HAD superfamily hydrolase (TIGR01509 family)
MISEELILPNRTFGAYLFDLDGTIADSMPLHFRSWTQAVEEGGGTFPEDVFYSWGGIPLPRTVEMLNEKFGYHLDPVATAHRKEQLYLALMDEVQPIASVVAQIEAQHGKIPLAVVSGSPRESIVRTLTSLHLLDRFDVLVGAEDYTHGKPDPEPFLVAASRLRVAPADCLVFEDAEAGIRSAEAAGMAWVRVPVKRLAQIS